MLSMSRDPIRQAYEDRIRDSVPQEIILYACDEGEPAGANRKGSAYLYYLLHATEKALTHSASPFISVSRAHRKAASLLRRDPSVEQRPQIQQPHCLRNQRLPLAINPNVWKT